MISPNHKKNSISFTINQKLLNQMNSIIQTGKFSSRSDIVNIATAFFLGELSTKRTKPNFDYSKIVEDIPIDDSKSEKISVTLSEYVDIELEDLARVTQKNKSFIVRIALIRFFEFYNNTEEIKKSIVISEEKLTVSKNELEKIIQKILTETLKEKK